VVWAAPMSDVHSAVFQKVLAEERLQTARLYNFYRFIGISAFFVLVLVMQGVVRNPAWAGNLGFFAAYWATAGVMWVWGRRSDLFTRLAGLAIPFVDMPVVLLLHLAALPRTNAGFVVGSTTGFYILLIIGATVAFDAREIIAAAATAAVLQAVLQVRAGFGLGIMVFTTFMIVLATLGCTHVIRRVRHLVAGVTLEHLRRERLGRYFSPDVAAMLATAPERGPAAESREVTLLFADLREFTTLTERLAGPEVVALLNGYHERMVRQIFALGGTLDKYLGDGLMVYFGAPVPQPDHPERGVRCALAMQGEVEAWNREREARGEALLRMAIGIHTGTVILGDIGTPHRREYTAVGDAVNVAARLEQLAKAKNLPVLVSDATQQQLGATVRLISAGTVELRGRQQPLALWVPAGSVPS